MKRKIWVATIVCALSTVLLLLPAIVVKARAADKLGWVGPVYTELSESLTKGFKDYYKKTTGKDVDITFIRPGGWPVCLDKVRAWGAKPDADVFLGAGAPAHEVLKQEGRIVPYRPTDWDKIPAEWHGMKVKGQRRLLDLFLPLDCHQPVQRESPEKAETAAAENMAGPGQSHLPGKPSLYVAICFRHHA